MIFNKLLAMVTFTAVGSENRYACEAVGAVISNASNVYYPGHRLYTKGMYHHTASSQENPACVVEPGTANDIGKILRVIEATKVPFAIKSGGHTANPGFSSTKGIHIYTGRFSQVTYDADSGTAVIGAGLIWDTVYERLQGYGVTVVGGRVTGVGVGGFLLGGGYSYKTNQYGLSIDTIVGYNLVLPNGTVTYVTESTHPDLFFGLKGGFNNFGIVTDFTMTAFPQTEVWGGQIVYRASHFDEIRGAISDFSANSKDPKAAILPTYVSWAGAPFVTQGIFYDGPTPPPGTFSSFTKIPSVTRDLKVRSYTDMILSSRSNSTAGFRGCFSMITVSHFSQTLLKAVEHEMKYWSGQLLFKGGLVVSYSPEPFLPSHLSHSSSPSAFPAPSARLGNAPSPLLIYFGWKGSRYDHDFVAAVKETAKRLTVIAEAEGLLHKDPSIVYGNYAHAETPLEHIYGENLTLLRKLRARIDPDNVMGLAGGFKF